MDISTIWWILRTLFNSVKEGGELMEKGGKLVEGSRAIAEQIVKWGRGLVGIKAPEEIKKDLETRVLSLDKLPKEIKEKLADKRSTDKIFFTQLPPRVQETIINFLNEKVSLISSSKEWDSYIYLFSKELSNRLKKIIEKEIGSKPVFQKNKIKGNDNNSFNINNSHNNEIVIGDKVIGDKIMGDKVEEHYHFHDDEKKKVIISNAILGKIKLIGRKKEFKKAKEILLTNNTDKIGVWIYGIAGIGKTALTKALYNSISHNFENEIILILSQEEGDDLTSPTILHQKLVEAFLEISQFSKTSKIELTLRQFQREIESQKLSIEEKANKILHILDSQLVDYRKIIIIDNLINTREYKFCEFFKKLISLPLAKTIITSRQRYTCSSYSFPFENIHLSSLSENDALELFYRRYRKIKWEKEDFDTPFGKKTEDPKLETIKELLKEIQYHPFLIEHLSKFLAINRGWGLNEEDLLEKVKEFNLSSIDINVEGEKFEKEIKRLLTISWLFLKEDEREVLKKISLLPSNLSFNREFFLEYFKKDKESLALIKKGIIELIEAKGWLNSEENNYEKRWFFHSLIKEYLLRVVGVKFEEIEPQIEWALEKMGDTGNSGRAVELNQGGYLPILEGIGGSLKLLFQEPSTEEWKREKKQVVQIGTIFLRIGTLFLHWKEYSKAEKYLIEAKEIFKKIFREKHPSIATSYNNLGLLYYDQGDYTQAEEYYKRALKIWKKLLGEKHRGIATFYHNLGTLYYSQGDYAKAGEYYKNTLEIRKKLLGEEHSNTAASYNNLGELYRIQGDYTQAEEYYKRALEIFEKVFGEEHPDTAASYNNLGSLYYSQGNYTKAEWYYQKALEITKKLLGENHPYIALSYNNLGLLYHDQGDYTQAEEYYKRALKILKKLLGENHPYIALSYNNLGLLYHDQGDYTQAEEYYKRALEIFEKILGEKHPDTAQTYNNLGSLYYSQGNYTKAEWYYQKALEITKKLFGENHPSTATSYNNLGGLYYYRGDYQRAKEYLEKALKIWRNTLGENHPDTQRAKTNLEEVEKKLKEKEGKES
jgi:tetratricopeptide (TPR) repeat protein